MCQELKKRLASGAVVEVRQEDMLVVNPLRVVKNASGKSRLILDLHYVNNPLRSCKFKYEGIPAALELFQKDGWVFMFDYKSGYNHLDIFAGHTTFSCICKDFVLLDRLPGFYVSCHGSSCTSLHKSNVQRHLPSPVLGSTNMFVF